MNASIIPTSVGKTVVVRTLPVPILATVTRATRENPVQVWFFFFLITFQFHSLAISDHQVHLVYLFQS